MPQKTFSHESLQDNTSIADYLTAILKGIKKGELSLSGGDSHLTFMLGKLLKLKVEASQEDDFNKLSISLSWSNPTKASSTKDSLKIR